MRIIEMTTENSKNDKPGVIAPPPLIFAAGILAGAAVGRVVPAPMMPFNAAVVLGALLILFGFGVIFVAWRQMVAAKTNIEPWRPTTAIIDSGLYAVSRNPIYVAMVEVYLGLSLIANSVWCLVFLPVVMAVIHYGVVLREERYLEAKFGDEYRDYMSRVKRWM